MYCVLMYTPVGHCTKKNAVDCYIAVGSRSSEGDNTSRGGAGANWPSDPLFPHSCCPGRLHCSRCHGETETSKDFFTVVATNVNE